jgi:plastocyanin
VHSPLGRFTCLGAAALLALLGGCGSSKSGSSESGAGATSSSTSSSSGSSSGGHKGPQSSITFTRGKEPNWAKVPASAPARSGLVPIAYRYFAIDPDTLKVKVGSTVRWTNYDPSPHNVTSEGHSAVKLASGNFGEGASFEAKMTAPGVIHYESTNYPTTMNGTILVVE